MKEIFVVTGNPGKLKEIQASFPHLVKLTAVNFDVTEIQSWDPQELVRDKLDKAYVAAGGPVIVDDMWAELKGLNNLPGPYVKDFQERLGHGALYELVKHVDDKRATVRCFIGFYDGKDYVIVEGSQTGTIVSPRGSDGFGFDFTFMPDGQTQTYAQMDRSVKNSTSYRYIAIKKLVERLFPGEKHG